MPKIEDIKLLEKIIRGMDVTNFYEKDLKQIIQDLEGVNWELFWFEKTDKEILNRKIGIFLEFYMTVSLIANAFDYIWWFVYIIWTWKF